MAAEPDAVRSGADRLAKAEHELTRLAAKISALQAAVSAAAELSSTITALSTRVDQLSNQLAGTGASHPAGGPTPVTWRDVTPAQADAVLVELAGWVATVLPPYRVATLLLPCWYRHPGVVQLLLDTRLAWLTAYRDPAGGQVPAALEWSQRHLPHLENQLRDLLGRCSTVRHCPPEPPPPPVSEATLRAYARWWAGDRDPDREPGPPETGRVSRR